MGRDRPSLQDQIRRRQQSGFVGRQGEVVQFEDNLRLAVDDQARKFLFNIHGDAGVGKTYLTKRLRQISIAEGCLAVYIDETIQDAVSAMTAVAEGLAREGVRLDEFEKRAAAYRKRRSEVESDASAPEGVAAFLTKTAVTIGLAAMRDVPGAGSLLAPVDASAVADQANQARKYLAQKFSDRGDAQLLLSPEEELTPLFVAGLNRVAAQRPIAVFVDTYERTGLILDAWLRSLYAGRYGDLPATLITTISGQGPLEAGRWADYLPVIADIFLDPFNEAEARLFLAGKGIDDESTVQVILTLSGRLPLWLATLAEARPASAADVGDPAGSVVERFLKWEDDAERRGTALAAAFPRLLNRDVLSVVAPDANADELFGWLCRLPFVTQRGSSHWEYHEVVRSAMLRLQMAQAPADWRGSHTALAGAYEEWAKEAADKSGRTWADPSWAGCMREAMYHRLCADPVNSLRTVLASALEAAEHGGIRLRQWAQLIIDASRDTGDDVLGQYGQRLRDLVNGAEDELAAYFSEPETSPAASAPPADNRGPRQGLFSARSAKPGAPRDDLARSGAGAGITMLGSSGSGKTTFLAALAVALNQHGQDWRLIPEDEKSAEQLIRLTSLLTDDRQFPSATTDIFEYGWALNGTVHRVKRTGFRKKAYQESVQLGLQLIDIPGETLHSSQVGTRRQIELINRTAATDGIVVLIDPIREADFGGTYNFVFGALTQLMQRASYAAGTAVSRLPQYIAVCMTKFDNQYVYQAAERLGVLSEDPGGFPRVGDSNARRFIREFLNSASGGTGDALINMLESYGIPNRIEYYVTSAIGFHLGPQDVSFDDSDASNVILDKSGRNGVAIRGSLRPINVAEPLLWLCEKLIADRDTR